MILFTIFSSSFLLTEIIFINSEFLNTELITQDLNRFLRLNNVEIPYSYISLLIGLLNLLIYKITINFNKSLDNKQKVFFYYLLSNLSVVLFIFYFFRIYTASRFFIIVNLLFYPIVILFITSFQKMYKYSNYLIVIVFLISGIYMFTQQSSEDETSGYKPESLDVKSKKPEDYYPELEMSLIDGETEVLTYYPSLEENIKSYRSFENFHLGNFSYENKYMLKKYSICCYWLQYRNSGGKPIGYLENYDDYLIYAHGSGIFSYTKKDEIISGDFQFNLIDSNFHDVITNKYLYERNPAFDTLSNGWESIRDILIVKNKLYVSFVNEKSEDCVNVEVLVADLKLSYLDFDYFFINSECVLRTDYPLFNAMVAGGKMINTNNQEIFLATGDFRNWEKAQDDNSYLGKVISINIDNSEYKIISKGHRNPQGLAKTKKEDYIIETEHGPVGGDEINIIEIGQLQNFGWPVSSYGKHWFQENYEMKDGIAPLHNSHKDYGMREPLFYQYVGFFGGIGISDVEVNYFSDTDSFFVATLNGAQIFEIDVIIEENKMTNFNRFKINDRIRDMEYDPDNNVYYILLENSPAIGVFSKSDK